MAAAAPAANVVNSEQRAFRQFSDKLYDVRSKLSDGEYMELCSIAKSWYESKRTSPVDGAHNASRQNEMQDEVDYYREQLISATVMIDVIRDRVQFYSKAVGALKGVVAEAHIPDSKCMEAYARAGIKETVLREREKKRKRDEALLDRAEVIPVVELSESDRENEDSDSDGQQAWA